MELCDLIKPRPQMMPPLRAWMDADKNKPQSGAWACLVLSVNKMKNAILNFIVE